jgi:hypothetical protein
MKDTGQRSRSRLFLGARARMSKLGRERHPKYGAREGLIVGRGSPSSWRVNFDGHKTVQTIHQDYLEAVAGAGDTQTVLNRKNQSQHGCTGKRSVP